MEHDSKPLTPEEAAEANRAAIFVIDGTRYYVQMWFMAGPDQDFMAALWRAPTGPLTLTYRFRYYREAGPWGDDKKTRYDATINTSEEQAIAFVNELCDKLLGAGYRADGADGAGIHKIPLRTSDPAIIMRAFQACSFAHMKTGAEANAEQRRVIARAKEGSE